jgi:hypothetical protein
VGLARTNSGTQLSNPIRRVTEPELDMDRLQCRQSRAIEIFLELLRKLMPIGHWTMRSPMRSVAREIEEVWPSSDI